MGKKDKKEKKGKKDNKERNGKEEDISEATNEDPDLDDPKYAVVKLAEGTREFIPDAAHYAIGEAFKQWNRLLHKQADRITRARSSYFQQPTGRIILSNRMVALLMMMILEVQKPYYDATMSLAALRLTGGAQTAF